MRQAERRPEFQLSTKAETAEEAAETEAAEQEGGAGARAGAAEQELGAGAGEGEGEGEAEAEAEAARSSRNRRSSNQTSQECHFARDAFVLLGLFFSLWFYLSSVVRRFQMSFQSGLT